MAQQIIYTCDFCGVQKQDSNHWWLINVSNAPDAVEILTWDDSANGLMFCGENHVMQWLSKNFFVERKEE